MSFLKNLIPVPLLIPHSSNPNFPPIRLQYVPENFTREVKSNYAEANSLNRDSPIIQFTRGEAETFTFDAKLYSTHALHEVNSLLAILIRSTKRDEILRRPPVWFFIWGTAVQETVVIESIGGIKYGALRPDGLLREVNLTITLKRYVPYDIVLTDVNKVPKDDLLSRVTKSGMFWELLAFKTYGDAMAGVVLAYQQRKHVPTPGQTVSMPSRAQMEQKVVSPVSPPMKRTDSALAARSAIFKTRNARVKQSSVVVR